MLIDSALKHLLTQEHVHNTAVFSPRRAKAVSEQQRTVKACAASLQTSQAPPDLEPVPAADNPLLDLPPAQPLHLDLQQGALKAGEHVILQGMSQDMFISQRSEDGIVLGCQSKDGAAYSMIDTNLGQVRGSQQRCIPLQ